MIIQQEVILLINIKEAKEVGINLTVIILMEITPTEIALKVQAMALMEVEIVLMVEEITPMVMIIEEMEVEIIQEVPDQLILKLYLLEILDLIVKIETFKTSLEVQS
jgi:hypothetical protein